MLSKRTIHILLTFGMLALTVGLKYWYNDTIVLNSFATDISENIEKHTKDFEQVITSHGTRLPGILDEKGSLESRPERIIKELGSKPYTFFLTRGDSIVFWNNNSDLPQQEDLPLLVKAENETLVKTPAGHFFLLKRPHVGDMLYCLIPVKYEFGSNKLMRPNNFPASSSIPTVVSLSNQVNSAYVIKSPKGSEIGSLSAPAGVEYKQPANIQMVLFLAFVLLYFSLAYNMAAEIVKRRQGMPYAVVFMMATLCVFFALKFGFGLSNSFAGESLFAFNLESFGNLGDLLLTLGILLWLMIFFHKEHNQKRDKSQTHIVFRMVVATMNYLAVMMSVIISLFILRQLVQSSNVVFDFDNLFNLDVYNLLLIWGVIMMMGAMFLYSHKLMDSMKDLALNIYQRAGAIFIGGLAIAAIYYMGFPLNIDTGFVIFFTMLYVAAFDVFVQSRKVEFYWVLGWIGLYSFYAAIALYHYNQAKDIDTRLIYAKQLAEPKDSLVERELPDLLTRLNDLGNDSTFRDGLGVIGPTSYGDFLVKQIRKQLGDESYLDLYYKTSVAVFDRKNKAPQLKAQLPYEIAVDSFYTNGQTVNGAEK